jgi:hypothetical protein
MFKRRPYVKRSGASARPLRKVVRRYAAAADRGR